LSVGSLTRGLDNAWRRTSYSSLTASLHGTSAAEPGVSSEPEAREVEDEVDTTVAPDTAASLDEELLRAMPSPMAALPSGTTFGTLVHEVLENVDTSAPELPAEVAARCHEAAARRTTSATVDVATLTDALLLAMDTPLGPFDDDPRLRDVAPPDRLAELEFELPLAGGDSPVATDATLGAMAGLLRRHLPNGDVLAAYAEALDVPGLAAQRLRGYLTGSIDSVLRLRDTPGGEPRYVVVDYKTNWLGAFGPDGAEPLTAWHYRPAALAESMMHAHYPLQALLYSVALHRFLRWRQPSYNPGVHLGGVRYLYVRGMMGTATPVFDGGRCGVFAWTPPPALVEDLSALLDGRAP
jgi:exodeoxyribonuclease V beta subunit